MLASCAHPEPWWIEFVVYGTGDWDGCDSSRRIGQVGVAEGLQEVSAEWAGWVDQYGGQMVGRSEGAILLRWYIACALPELAYVVQEAGQS